MTRTVSWRTFEGAQPELARTARLLFDVHKHKTLATLRGDGSPRISGTEISFVGDDIWFGAMWHSRKALDLRRDPPACAPRTYCGSIREVGGRCQDRRSGD